MAWWGDCRNTRQERRHSWIPMDRRHTTRSHCTGLLLSNLILLFSKSGYFVLILSYLQCRWRRIFQPQECFITKTSLWHYRRQLKVLTFILTMEIFSLWSPHPWKTRMKAQVGAQYCDILVYYSEHSTSLEHLGLLYEWCLWCADCKNVLYILLV